MPTALLCTDEFGPLGRAEAEVLGMAGLPLIAIPHPLAGNHEPLVASKAAGVGDEIHRALTADAGELAAVYRGRFTTLTERRLEGGAVCIDDQCAIDPVLVTR